MMKYTYLFFFFILFIGCKKENSPIKLEGNYAGVFEAYSGSSEISARTEVYFNADRFIVKKGYKLGSGTFNVISSNEIEFKDENFWTAEFDWALLLAGKYKYEIKGGYLILTKYTNGGKEIAKNRYQYKIKKTTNAGQPEL